jgi:hypothetical protein
LARTAGIEEANGNEQMSRRLSLPFPLDPSSLPSFRMPDPSLKQSGCINRCGGHIRVHAPEPMLTALETSQINLIRLAGDLRSRDKYLQSFAEGLTARADVLGGSWAHGCTEQLH